MNSRDTRRDPKRFERLSRMVEEGASINEIMRTLNMDNRTIKRHFPDYKPFPQGGGKESSMIRQVNQDLLRLDQYGNLSTRRGRK